MNTRHETRSGTTVILGGAGKTGRRVAARLAARGVPARFASRSGDTAFDWTNRESWGRALAGATAAYVAYQPDVGAPGAADDLAHLGDVARRLGVRRVVLLSGRGEPQAEAAERALRDAVRSLTIVRAAWFSQNFSEGVLCDGVVRGTIAFPAAAVREPFVDADDIADVAAAALTDDAHAGQTYELTGPRLLTFAEATEEIGRAIGRDVRYAAISFEEYGAALAEHVPPEIARFYVDLFSSLLDGHNAHLTSDVERVLGRSPRDFREFARDAAAEGAFRAHS